jgi:acyl carrier protein
MSPEHREIWLRALVTRISGRSAAATGPDDALQEAVGLDSLGRLEVLAAFEDGCGFLFDDAEGADICTLGQTLDLIAQKLRAREEAAP